MNDRLYSVDEVAERLGLHVRTVRNYVRDGRLRAVRIGKQYRITHEDLEAFTGRPVPSSLRETVARNRHSEVSSIVEIDAVDPVTVDRVTTLLMTAAAHGRPGEQRLRIETVHDKERARMKIIVLGGLADTARLLDSIEGVLTL
ncbi:helix-turn-helix domain-containing protein [Streptomyces sp. MST-110588]|uniref:helix-turn-helix domain-containing protein n=1 Tax=Streptomyces sp. MST-110588 TaxID=2833628 RepID=UPI001F5D32C3|nr:helix-turn-helix domain-containing protein [Streptomyces sp. MST-110588]UNO38427.1 helix-turn-helix domain-containing protein [Streptomyces sp. MST-110588]